METGDEPLQRPDAARPRGRLEALEPDADERWQRTVAVEVGERGHRRVDGGVLRLVPHVAEAVLEVDAQVLDRLATQLRHDELADAVTLLPRRHQAVHLEQVGRATGPVERVEGGAAPVGDRGSVEPVRGYVDRVHRLPRRRRPRVALGELRVRAGQQRLDARERCLPGAHP